MIVRIRLSRIARTQRKERKNQHIALAVASLLTPSAVMACVLAFWRLLSDFKATGEFPITAGLFSHWQVWLACAVMLQTSAVVLNRYGKPESSFRKTIE